jgi:hypothetical protein
MEQVPGVLLFTQGCVGQVYWAFAVFCFASVLSDFVPDCANIVAVAMVNKNGNINFFIFSFFTIDR